MMRRLGGRFAVAATVLAIVAPLSTVWLAAPAAASVTLIDGFGTNEYDWGNDLVRDSAGNLYMGGTVGTASYPVHTDAYLYKYNASGARVRSSVISSKPEGTRSEVDGVARDSAGNIYVAGFTNGTIQGTHVGYEDLFVRKYNSSFAVQWTRQFGTPTYDYATGVAVDPSGNVYVSGRSEGRLPGTTAALGAFLVKFNSSGTRQWTREFGSTTLDYGARVRTDASGNAYLAGTLNAHGFLREYSPNGSIVWKVDQLSTSNVDDVTLVGSAMYVVGANTTTSAGTNALVRKYTLKGSPATWQKTWQRVFGSDQDDQATAVSVDGSGNVFVGGETYGALAVPDSEDPLNNDIFIREYKASGTEKWTQQMGTGDYQSNYTEALVADRTGGAFVAGGTTGSFTGGTGYDNTDAYLIHVLADTAVVPTVTEQPTDTYTRLGAAATFSADAASYEWPMTVQWQVDSGSGWTAFTGKTSKDLTFTPTYAMNGNRYRAAFTNAAGTTYSTAATLIVANNQIVTTSATASSGYVTVVFTASGTPTLTGFQCNVGRSGAWVACTSGVPVKGSASSVTVRGYDGYEYVSSQPAPVTP